MILTRLSRNQQVQWKIQHKAKDEITRQDISRLLRCMTNVNVIAGENVLKTTQSTSCVYQRKPVIT